MAKSSRVIWCLLILCSFVHNCIDTISSMPILFLCCKTFMLLFWFEILTQVLMWSTEVECCFSGIRGTKMYPWKHYPLAGIRSCYKFKDDACSPRHWCRNSITKQWHQSFIQCDGCSTTHRYNYCNMCRTIEGSCLLRVIRDRIMTVSLFCFLFWFSFGR